MHPLFFEIGPFTIHSLWFFATLGIVSGVLLFSKLAKRHRLKLDFLAKNRAPLIISTIAASRIFFIIFNIDDFPTFASLITIWDRGLSFWGALLGFSGAVFYLAKKSGESLLLFFDVLALPLLLALLFGHIGAFLDGVGHGSATSLPWGMTFQSAVVKYAVPIHPTQLYAFFYTLALFVFLRKNAPRFMLKAEGFTAKLAVWGYSLFRFLEEFFRGDDTILLFSKVRVSQLIALAVFIAITYILIKKDESLFHKTVGKIARPLRYFHRYFHRSRDIS